MIVINCERSEQSLGERPGQITTLSVNFLNALYLPSFFPFSPEIVESAGQP